MRALCTQHHGLHSFHPVRNTSLPLPSVALEHAHTHTHTLSIHVMYTGRLCHTEQPLGLPAVYSHCT